MPGTKLPDIPGTAWSPPQEDTAREITEKLFKAKGGERVDLSGRNLRYLDLSGLDFKGASLVKSDLYGVDLTGANLKLADLSNARLDRTVIIQANFAGANLSGATLLRPTVHTSFAYKLSDAPNFAGANLTGMRAMARLDGANFRGADLSRADFSPHEWRPGQGTISTVMRNEMRSCDFSGGKLVETNLADAVLVFARLAGADLTRANLSGADLSKADLSGADLTGADLSRADLYGAILSGAKGLDTVKGVATAINFDKAIH